MSILMQMLIEANGEEQAALYQEIEGGELSVGVLSAMFERQPFFRCHLVVISQSCSRIGTLWQVASSATNDHVLPDTYHIVSNERLTAYLSICIYEKQPFAFRLTGKSIADAGTSKIMAGLEEAATRQGSCIAVLPYDVPVRRAVIAHNDFAILRKLQLQLSHQTATVTIECRDKNGEFHTVIFVQR